MQKIQAALQLNQDHLTGLGCLGLGPDMKGQLFYDVFLLFALRNIDHDISLDSMFLENARNAERLSCKFSFVVYGDRKSVV